MSRIITAIIFDDQKGAIDTLKKDLDSTSDFKVIDTCSSPTKAREAIFSFRPLVLFIDVEMPRITGIEFVKSIQEQVDWQMDVVFYSAFDKYILDALRNNATDFLLKPNLPTELTVVLDRMRQKQLSGNITAANSPSQVNVGVGRIALHTITGLSLFPKDDVLYFERIDNTWHLILTDVKKYSLKSSIGKADIIQACGSLVLVNPGIIINIEHPSSIENKTLRCIFYPPFNSVNSEIVVSRRNFQKIRTMLNCL